MTQLSADERNDLRRKVLMGEELSLDQAKAVIESLRVNRGAAVLSGDGKPKGKAKGKGMSDDQLDQDLAGLGL